MLLSLLKGYKNVKTTVLVLSSSSLMRLLVQEWSAGGASSPEQLSLHLGSMSGADGAERQRMRSWQLCRAWLTWLLVNHFDFSQCSQSPHGRRKHLREQSLLGSKRLHANRIKAIRLQIIGFSKLFIIII